MQDNREKVIETAQRLLREQGYHATGIQAILAESRVSRSNLYYHFRSKRELAEAVIARWREGLEKQFADTIAGESSYRRQVERFVQLFIDIQQSDTFAVCPFGRLAMELGDREPELRKRINQVFDSFRDALSDLIARGVAAGEFKADTDPRRLANALLVAIEGGIVLSRAQGHAEAMADACRLILECA